MDLPVPQVKLIGFAKRDQTIRAAKRARLAESVPEPELQPEAEVHRLLADECLGQGCPASLEEWLGFAACHAAYDLAQKWTKLVLHCNCSKAH